QPAARAPGTVADQPQRAAPVVDRAQDDASGEQAGVDGAPAALVDDRLHRGLAEQGRDLGVGREIRGHQAGEGGGVEVAAASGGGDELPGPVYEVDREGVGPFQQLAQNPVNRSKVVFEQSPLGHHALPGTADRGPPTEGKPWRTSNVPRKRY